MKINEVAKVSGVSSGTLHYYDDKTNKTRKWV